jgi:membrane-bound serine protease (ClpP class)
MQIPSFTFRTLRALIAVLAGCLCAGLAAQDSKVERSKTAVVLEISDAIGPATSDFFIRALKKARESNATLVILQLDTPGGLDTAMRDMIRAILASEIPVVIYVAPSGARAASAGTYLLYASHVAAMAPATNLGAATPVQIGASPERTPGEQPKDKPQDKSKDEEPTQPGTSMERKAVNDSVAYIRGLAELRGRNADWAENAVRTAASLSASAALEQKVVDVVAADIPDLLHQIDGREVKTSRGELKLVTRNLVVERVEGDWRTKFLAVLTNPNVAYLLMLVGVYGLLLEGYSPGAILPGVVGAISLLLALYAFQVLSVNYAGLALMILGIALIIAEAFAPSFGALGLGGVAAFVFGSVILMDTEVPGFQVARTLIGGVALAGAFVMLGAAMMFARARRRSVQTGREQMLREHAVAVEDFETTGLVRVHGEIWRAKSVTPIKEGQRLRIVRIEGLTLDVAPDA